METTQIGSKQRSRIMLKSSMLYFRDGNKRKKKRENEIRADHSRGCEVSISVFVGVPAKRILKAGFEGG